MNAPLKPFATFKWRWLSVQPSEGLLQAPVFLGVLRALLKHEGQPYSSPGLHQTLVRVREETHSDVDLARTPERNLFRNSGQYWRGTGLLLPVRGEIQLTNLGRKIAAGDITNDEFAALMIRNTVLPNPQTYSTGEMARWNEAGLRIKPFQIILSIMDQLGKAYGVDEAFLTPNELIRIVIPLSGASSEADEMADAVHQYRNGELDISTWPDCAPEANDKRLAREFLLFLDYFGICSRDDAADRYEQKFGIDQVLSSEMVIDDAPTFLEEEALIDDEMEISQNSEIPIIIERKRVNASVLRRTNQSKFRKEVLLAAAGQCILTEEETPDVLEAAHIIPVEHGGADDVGNGFCMRVDIHRLFDGGKIRILPSGDVQLNDQIKRAVSYNKLPGQINFSANVNVENVRWRSRYL